MTMLYMHEHTHPDRLHELVECDHTHTHTHTHTSLLCVNSPNVIILSSLKRMKLMSPYSMVLVDLLSGMKMSRIEMSLRSVACVCSCVCVCVGSCGR
jgi:hypothetical protein